MEIKIFLKNGFWPVKATSGSAGFDIYCVEDIELLPSKIVLVPTGIYMQFPPSYECQIRSRSSMAMKGVIIPNSPGTIDSDYRDEIKIIMLNLNSHPIQLRKRDKIAQMVFCKLSNVNMQFLDWEEFQRGGETERKGGFGSTDA